MLENKLSTNWRPLNLAIVAEGANLILFRGKMAPSLEVLK